MAGHAYRHTVASRSDGRVEVGVFGDEHGQWPRPKRLTQQGKRRW